MKELDGLDILEGVLDKYTFFSYQGLVKPIMFYSEIGSRYYQFRSAKNRLISLFERNRILALTKEQCTKKSIVNLKQIEAYDRSMWRQMMHGLEVDSIMCKVLEEIKEIKWIIEK